MPSWISTSDYNNIPRTHGESLALSESAGQADLTSTHGGRQAQPSSDKIDQTPANCRLVSGKKS